MPKVYLVNIADVAWFPVRELKQDADSRQDLERTALSLSWALDDLFYNAQKLKTEFCVTLTLQYTNGEPDGVVCVRLEQHIPEQKAALRLSQVLGNRDVWVYDTRELVFRDTIYNMEPLTDRLQQMLQRYGKVVIMRDQVMVASGMRSLDVKEAVAISGRCGEV